MVSRCSLPLACVYLDLGLVPSNLFSRGRGSVVSNDLPLPSWDATSTDLFSSLKGCIDLIYIRILQ